MNDILDFERGKAIVAQIVVPPPRRTRDRIVFAAHDIHCGQTHLGNVHLVARVKRLVDVFFRDVDVNLTNIRLVGCKIKKS